jgi:hypothetical protein
MTGGLRLAPLFLRRGNQGDDLTALGLTAVGVAVAVALSLVALSLRPAFDARDDRMAWREPTAAADGEATALQVRSMEIFDGDLVDRVDLAPTDANDSTAASLPVPPGLDEFPQAGEVYVSPALRRLLDRQDDDGRLADRFPGEIAGTIGSDGLAHPDELVAVVSPGPGVLTADPAGERTAAAGRLPDDPSAVTPIATFATTGDHPSLEIYKVTASMGAVLLVVPALLLVGSAARLTAARRNQRLAVLRLAGATPGAVVALTAAETAAAALVGSVLGVGLYLAVLPAVAHASVAGGPSSVADLWLGAPALLLTLVVTPLLAAASAAVALRQVVVSPLGVAQRTSGRRPRVVRLAGMVAAWGHSPSPPSRSAAAARPTRCSCRS